MGKIDPKYCTGNQGIVGHTITAYNNIGFSPCCEEFVSHVVNKKCNIQNKTLDLYPSARKCTCRTDSCPCGVMISHRISESCTADETAQVDPKDFIGYRPE